jgi:hypothetical protein
MNSKKRIASFQRRTLSTMAEKMKTMRQQWSGLDDEMYNNLNKLQRTVANSIKKIDEKTDTIDEQRTAREAELKQEIKDLREQLRKNKHKEECLMEN